MPVLRMWLALQRTQEKFYLYCPSLILPVLQVTLGSEAIIMPTLTAAPGTVALAAGTVGSAAGDATFC